MPSIHSLLRLAIAASVTLGVCALAAACSDATAPGGLASTITATRTTGTFPDPAPVVHVDADAVRIDGQLSTPTPCYSLSSAASISHDTLVVRVSWHSTLKGNEACPQMVQPWLYTVAVTGLPYDLTAIRVIHAYGIGSEAVVLQQPIFVP